MMSRRIDSLYICPWSLDDALCQSQSWAYVRALADSGRVFAFMTFENSGESSAPRQIHENVTWYPVKWDAGNKLSTKILGIIRVIAKGSWIGIKSRPRLVHSRTSLPAFMAVCLKLLFRCKFLYDADSMLSDEYADTGHLSTESNGFRFLRWSEGWARRNADEVIVLTDVIRQIYRNDLNVKKPIEVIPCCVDGSKFKFNESARQSIRDQLGLSEEPLLAYVGKVGSWYLVEETFVFFNAFRALVPDAKLLILSTDDPVIFDQIANEHGVGHEHYFVRQSSYEKVSEWLSAADAGLALIKQVASKRGSSPVKFAEYLSCGLPVVITDGIGDCSWIINSYEVGVVLINTLKEDVYQKGAVDLLQLLSDSEGIGERCRSVANKEFELTSVGITRYRGLYERLLGT